MVASLFLSEKLRRPTPVGLSRARLEQPLVQADGPGLTLVAAPAGSGKSTLLARVGAMAGVPVAWYRATAEDANSDTLLSNLGYALATTMSAGPAGGGPASSYNLDSLLAVVGDGLPALLIVDDLHEIAGTRGEQAVKTLVSARPQSLRMILASRKMPEFDLASLRVAGAIHELNSDDLRFRVWEVEELFTIVHNEPLSPETAAALTRRTGGWAAGLQLFHLAHTRKTRLARQQAVAALGPRARLVRAYLARNVLDELPETRRQFLVRTSALGLLTGALCDALLSTTGSAAVLEDLERDQVFTTSVDDGLTYRYHEVLQRHLQMTLLLELGADGAREWYARCAELLDAAGAHGDAIRAYAMAEDWSSMARLVRSNSADSTTAIAAEQGHLLPPALVEADPWLALADARRRLRYGALEAAVAGFEHAEALLDEPRFQNTCANERDAIRVWLPGVVDMLDSVDATTAWSSRIRAATRTGRRARLSSSAHRAANVHYFGRDAVVGAVEALIAGNLESARAHFADALASTPEVSMARLASLLGGVVVDAADGRATDYVARLEEITLDADAGGYPWVSRLARGVLSAILAVSDAAPWRLDAISELLTECDRAGDAWGAALLQLAGAIAAALVGHVAAPGRFGEAERRLNELDARSVASCAHNLVMRYQTRISSRRSSGTPKDSGVHLVCFGAFRILLRGLPVDLDLLRPRARALLRILALEHGNNVHRERLIDALWPGEALDVGTRRLQVAVSSVRHVLQQHEITDVDPVQRSGESYRLTLNASVDVRQFEDLVAAARRERTSESRRIELWTRALDLYQGDLFPEEGAAEHIVRERERLRLVAADAACRLAHDHASTGNVSAAVTATRRSLDLDHYQDLAWRLLVDCLAAAGDDTAAKRARLEHSRVRASLI